MLRLAKTSGQGGGKESAGIAAAKSMGARVDVKTFGPITCSTMIPPASLPCTDLTRPVPWSRTGVWPQFEVTAKTQKDMTAIDKLRPVGGKDGRTFVIE